MLTKALLLGLAAGVNAHMIMQTPFGWTPVTDNGPLHEDMSNFPCNMNGRPYDRSKTTTYALGSTQTLRLQGSAVHGGGSGQVSISYDTAPNKNSQWKVIKSFIGGMPSRTATANLAGDMSTMGDDVYSFIVPKDIPAGPATLAWSWINKHGNREFYMSCGPIELTGSGGSKAAYDALPDMFIANIGPHCKIQAGTDVIFPNPGKNVEQHQGGNANPVKPAAECGKVVSPPGGIFIPNPEPNNPPTETKPPTTPPVNNPPVNNPPVNNPPVNNPPVSSPPATNPPAAGAQTPGTACTSEGAYVCLTTSYQQCGSGLWSVTMPLAAGTKCELGAGGTLNIVLAKRSRMGALLSN
jgi:hypothetical protein